MEIITRAEARERGLTRYFTGKPCKNGHISERTVSRMICILCQKAFDQKRRSDPMVRMERSRREKERYHSDPATRERAIARAMTPEALEKSRERKKTPKAQARSKELERKRQLDERKSARRRELAQLRRAIDPSFRQRHADQERLRRAKRAQDPLYVAIRRARTAVTTALRRRGFSKSSKTAEIIGCSWEFFRDHIERQFLSGMTWTNRHLWHIDHIVPMATATTESEAISLNHFTNLRPLWGPDNSAKGSKQTHLI